MESLFSKIILMLKSNWAQVLGRPSLGLWTLPVERGEHHLSHWLTCKAPHDQKGRSSNWFCLGCRWDYQPVLWYVRLVLGEGRVLDIRQTEFLAQVPEWSAWHSCVPWLSGVGRLVSEWRLPHPGSVCHHTWQLVHRHVGSIVSHPPVSAHAHVWCIF